MSDDRLLNHLLSRWDTARERGEDVPAEDLCREYPDLLPVVRRQIEVLRIFESLRLPLVAGAGKDGCTHRTGPEQGGLR